MPITRGMHSRSLLTAVAAGVLALTGSAVPAEAAEPKSALVITAYDNYEPTAPNPAVIAKMTLQCEPGGGTHPDPRRACAALKKVNGDFAALRKKQVACTLILQPVLVKVSGHWRGRMVTFARDYSNYCVAYAESDGVFQIRSGTAN
jgi:hypothetical protein